jgi:hypothetical protein
MWNKQESEQLYFNPHVKYTCYWNEEKEHKISLKMLDKDTKY